MTLADKITSIRLIFAPFFFIVYFLHRFLPIEGNQIWIVVVLWSIFILTGISDFLDGYIARRMGEINDFGKFYDPFADTLTQITYLLCMVLDGLMPGVLFLLVLYREFSILFIRNLMLKKGAALGARFSGKLKTVFYIIAIGFALLVSSLIRLELFGEYIPLAKNISVGVFTISVLISIFSLFDYIFVYRQKT